MHGGHHSPAMQYTHSEVVQPDRVGSAPVDCSHHTLSHMDDLSSLRIGDVSESLRIGDVSESLRIGDVSELMFIVEVMLVYSGSDIDNTSVSYIYSGGHVGICGFRH